MHQVQIHVCHTQHVSRPRQQPGKRDDAERLLTVHAETLETGREGSSRVALVAVPELGRHEDLGARDLAVADRLSNVLLIAVCNAAIASAAEAAALSPLTDSGRVDVTVSALERIEHRLVALVMAALINTESLQQRNKSRERSRLMRMLSMRTRTYRERNPLILLSRVSQSDGGANGELAVSFLLLGFGFALLDFLNLGLLLLAFHVSGSPSLSFGALSSRNATTSMSHCARPTARSPN